MMLESFGASFQVEEFVLSICPATRLKTTKTILGFSSCRVVVVLVMMLSFAEPSKGDVDIGSFS